MLHVILNQKVQNKKFHLVNFRHLEAGNAAEKDIAIKLKECNFDEFSKDTEGKWVAVKDIKITFGGKTISVLIKNS